MEFRILGPVEVVGTDGSRVDPGGRRERAVLGLLLLSPGQVVPAARLIEDLWSDPDSSVKDRAHAVRVYLSRLRRALRGAGDGSAIETCSPGYRIRADIAALDAARFEDTVGRARSAAAGGDHELSAGLFREALALWRGPALAESPTRRGWRRPPPGSTRPGSSLWRNGSRPTWCAAATATWSASWSR